MLGYCAVPNVFLSTGLFVQRLCRMCKCAYVAVLIKNCSHNEAAGGAGSVLLFWVSGGRVGVQAVCCLRGILKWKSFNGEPTVPVFSRFQLGDSGVTLLQYFSLCSGPSCCRHRVWWSWVGLGAMKGLLQLSKPLACFYEPRTRLRSLSKFSFVWCNRDCFLFFRRWLFIDTARNIYG